MERRGTFDYILLETTGLADPGNLAPLFWVDEGLGSTIYLDGIVTLVDAKNVLRSLDEPVGEEQVEDDEAGSHALGPHLSTAHLQISHADVIVINKADLVSEAELQAVQDRVQSINALAKVEVTDHSRIPELEGLVLDLHAYDDISADALDFASKGHSHLDPAIGTIVLDVPVLDEASLPKLDRWLRSTLWEGKLPGEGDRGSWEVHRVKGRLPMQSGSVKVLQGVREIFELIDANGGSDGSGSGGKIVLIGRNIASDGVAARFRQSLSRAMAR